MAYDRYVQHPASGTGGATDFLAADRPLGAGRHQVILAGNAAHLAGQNSTRVLATHPGVGPIWQPSYRGGAGYAGAPERFDFDWTKRWSGYAPAEDGYCVLSLGTHYAHRWPGTARLPKLVVRVREWVAATFTCGVYLAVAPGRASIPSVSAEGETSTTFTDTTPTDKALVMYLSDACVRPWTAAATGEAGTLAQFTVYLAAYCSSGVKGSDAYLMGIVLTLEDPS